MTTDRTSTGVGIGNFVYGAVVLLGVAQTAIDFPASGPASGLALAGLTCVVAGLTALAHRWFA